LLLIIEQKLVFFPEF